MLCWYCNDTCPTPPLSVPLGPLRMRTKRRRTSMRWMQIDKKIRKDENRVLNQNIYRLHGQFCSYPCGIAYIRDSSVYSQKDKYNVAMNIGVFLKQLHYNATAEIKAMWQFIPRRAAPSRLLLKCYGGNWSRALFRSSLCKCSKPSINEHDFRNTAKRKKVDLYGVKSVFLCNEMLHCNKNVRGIQNHDNMDHLTNFGFNEHIVLQQKPIREKKTKLRSSKTKQRIGILRKLRSENIKETKEKASNSDVCDIDKFF